eukprot:Nk52_evm37s2449 gene=Nk52_evmTU37s2449
MRVLSMTSRSLLLLSLVLFLVAVFCTFVHADSLLAASAGFPEETTLLNLSKTNVAGLENEETKGEELIKEMERVFENTPQWGNQSSGSLSRRSSTTTTSTFAHDGERDQRLIMYVFGGLAIGALTRQFMADFAIPYTVIVLLEGIVLGVLAKQFDEVADYTHMASVDGHLLLLIFLPALIFESAFALDLHIFKNVAKQCLFLATTAILMASLLTAVCAKFFFGYEWSWIESILFGTIVSATDPVAVVALLADLGASKKLGTLIEGESLLNDGTAIVIFAVFFDGVEKGHLQPVGDIIGIFFRMAIGGPAIGAAMGFMFVAWVGHVFNDALVEISITLCSTYLVYWVSEIWLGSSGVLAVVSLGIVLNHYRTRISAEVEHFLHRFWHMIAYLANTLIFFLVGTEISQNAIQGITGRDWGNLFIIYVCITVIRGAVLAGHWKPLLKVGYHFKWQEGIIAWWGGLRGAVGLALAVVVKNSNDVDQENYGDKVLFLTSGIVFLTLLVNATTIKPLLDVLGLNEVTFAKKLTIANAVRRIRAEQELTIRALKNDRFLSDSNWDMVHESVAITHPYEEVLDEYTKASKKSKVKKAFNSLGRKISEKVSVGEASKFLPRISLDGSLSNISSPGEKNGVEQNPLNKSIITLHELKGGRQSVAGDLAYISDIKLEAYHRYLKTQRTSFWRQYEDGVLGKDSVLMLNAEIDKAVDDGARTLQVEDILQYSEIPNVWIKVSSWPVLHNMIKYLINDRLSLAYDMGMGFMVSIEEANSLITHTTTDKQLCDEIIEASENTRKKVLLGMAELRRKYPEIAMAVKTKQAIRSVLNQGNAVLKGLQESGIMEDGDIGHLMMDMEKKVKDIQNLPSTVKPPSPEELLYQIPWLKVLPEDLTERIVEIAEKKSFDVNDFVVKIGEPSDSVFLISAGMIKISAGSFEDYSGPGIVIGEMGVLTGSNRTANVECLTEIQAFSIDAENLHTLMKESEVLKKALWTTAGTRAAFNLLSRQAPYYSWPQNRLKLFCEEGFIVERRNDKAFHVDRSEYLVLHGEVVCKDSANVYRPISRIAHHERYLKGTVGTILLVIPPSSEDKINLDEAFNSEDEDEDMSAGDIDRVQSDLIVGERRLSTTGIRRRQSHEAAKLMKGGDASVSQNPSMIHVPEMVGQPFGNEESGGRPNRNGSFFSNQEDMEAQTANALGVTKTPIGRSSFKVD